MTDEEIEDEHESFVENRITEFLSLGESWDEDGAREEAEREWLIYEASLKKA